MLLFHSVQGYVGDFRNFVIDTFRGYFRHCVCNVQLCIENICWFPNGLKLLVKIGRNIDDKGRHKPFYNYFDTNVNYSTIAYC